MGEQMLLQLFGNLDHKIDDLRDAVAKLEKSVALCQSRRHCTPVAGSFKPSRHRRAKLIAAASTLLLAAAAVAEHYLAR
jgi:hypothetical protein